MPQAITWGRGRDLSVLSALGYRRIALPLPYALRSVNAYLLEGRGSALVDCGLHTDEGERALLAGLREAGLGASDLRHAFVTHLHPDHIGMAGWLERAGALVVMHGPEARAARAMWFEGSRRVDDARAWLLRHGMPEVVAEGMREAWIESQLRVDPIAWIHEVADGDVVGLAARRFRVIWTPGHTDYHAMLFDEEERVLLAGDHVLPSITPNVGLYPSSRDDPLADFLAGIEKLRGLEVRLVLPAHGDPFTDLHGRVEELLAHHQVRLAAVREALAPGPIDAYAIARRLFPVLRSAHEERFAHAEVLAHLRYLQRRGEAEELVEAPVRWRLLG